MQKIILKILVAFAIFLGAGSAPAMAQATRTWVSGVGDDVNPCSRTAPCKTFAGAVSKTATGGEINCLDPGGFGAVTLTKSMTLDCTGTFGSILASSTTGVIINDSASGTPGTIKVILRGLSINGAGTIPGVNGIRFTSGASLTVDTVLIQNFGAAAPNGNGISFESTTAATLRVVNSTIVNNTGSGISLSGTGVVTASIDHATIIGNGNGINMIATAGFGHLKLSNSLLGSNTVDGLRIKNAGNDAFIAGNQIVGSVKSLDILSGASVTSYGNNVLGAGDAPTSTIPLQ